MYYVYILENKQGRSYIGSCQDLEIRLRKHNQNSVRSTKNKGPFKVIYQESFDSRTEARRRENQFKSYKDFNRVKVLLKIPSSPSSSLA